MQENIFLHRDVVRLLAAHVVCPSCLRAVCRLWAASLPPRRTSAEELLRLAENGCYALILWVANGRPTGLSSKEASWVYAGAGYFNHKKIQDLALASGASTWFFACYTAAARAKMWLLYNLSLDIHYLAADNLLCLSRVARDQGHADYAGMLEKVHAHLVHT
jgi:hypothetical protein